MTCENCTSFEYCKHIAEDIGFGQIKPPFVEGVEEICKDFERRRYETQR